MRIQAYRIANCCGEMIYYAAESVKEICFDQASLMSVWKKGPQCVHSFGFKYINVFFLQIRLGQIFNPYTNQIY